MRTRQWFFVLACVLVLDALTVTWITTFHTAHGQASAEKSSKAGLQTPSSKQSSESQPVSTENRGGSAGASQDRQPFDKGTEASSVTDDLNIDVQPPEYLAPTTGDGLQLPAVPSLSAPQLPLSSISDAVRDEMRKMFSAQSADLTLSSSLERSSVLHEAPVQEWQDHGQSLDRRFDIVQHLSAAAKMLLEESRFQVAGKQTEAAQATHEMSLQLRKMMMQLLHSEHPVRATSR